MTDSPSTIIKEKIVPKTDLIPPKLFNVIYMNDEITSMEFVVASLIGVFDHTEAVAEELCAAIHENGNAVVAVLPYEMAEQKGVEATILARNNNFPLLVRMEPASS